MEYGSIEREISIDATPEVVYEVISAPEHMREWWPDEAEL
ncbi:MAG TPA: SRPBCC family protein, partial [Nocardioides sp.]|nr:SRPBCC family protein [Nocardioides sp.]